jgi:hypothetical protein
VSVLGTGRYFPILSHPMCATHALRAVGGTPIVREK